jgi:hypothetical protein
MRTVGNVLLLNAMFIYEGGLGMLETDQDSIYYAQQKRSNTENV